MSTKHFDVTVLDWPKAMAAELNQYLMDLIEHQIEKKLTTRRMREGNP